MWYRDEEKNTDGSEKEITYGEYVEKINKRALEEQKKIMLARMRGELKKQEDGDNWFHVALLAAYKFLS
jgi:hypothetical protein